MKQKELLWRFGLAIGLLSFLCSLLLRDFLPDFWLGFLEGVALALMGEWLASRLLRRLRRR